MKRLLMLGAAVLALLVLAIPALAGGNGYDKDYDHKEKRYVCVDGEVVKVRKGDEGWGDAHRSKWKAEKHCHRDTSSTSSTTSTTEGSTSTSVADSTTTSVDVDGTTTMIESTTTTVVEDTTTTTDPGGETTVTTTPTVPPSTLPHTGIENPGPVAVVGASIIVLGGLIALAARRKEDDLPTRKD